MRRQLVHFLALSLLATLLAAHSLAQVDTTAVIVAWNVEGFVAIDDVKVARLARALADIDAEVVALSEVNPDGVVDKLVLELSRLGACYQGKILDQTARQNLAVLYKTGVAVTEAQLVEGSDDGNPGLRKALTADVRVGQFDFKILVLHLKAGRSRSDRNTRTRQAAALAGFIDAATAGDEKDVLVVGDYNMRPDQDAENFTAMNSAGFLRFVSSEDLSGQVSHISDPATGFGSLLDGYAISREHTGEYIEGSLLILPLARMMGLTLREYVDGVSDHLPLAATFRVTEDDD